VLRIEKNIDGAKPDKEELKLGFRSMYFTELHTLARRLELRASHCQDAKVRLSQLPMQVGCSNDLQSCMVAHEYRGTKFKTSEAKPLRLLCGVLRRLEIEPEVVSIPIFKVWLPEQLHISEILLTLLTGSLIYEGGLNSKAPGGQKGKLTEGKFENTLAQIFDRPWTDNNIEKTEQDCLLILQEQENQKEIDRHLEEEFASSEELAKDVLRQAEEITSSTKAFTEEIKAANRAASLKLAMYEERLEEINSMAPLQAAYKAFADELRKVLNSSNT